MASVQQGEKQLFEKFWKGTFKAVASPRPGSIIVTSITSRKPLPRLSFGLCPQPGPLIRCPAGSGRIKLLDLSPDKTHCGNILVHGRIPLLLQIFMLVFVPSISGHDCIRFTAGAESAAREHSWG
uniref:Uncharacterized protein n=1 Tax=Sphaerodactylus townsendi TaxID=933632 RepID=A0ACB8FYT0_9SAUR